MSFLALWLRIDLKADERVLYTHLDIHLAEHVSPFPCSATREWTGAYSREWECSLVPPETLMPMLGCVITCVATFCQELEVFEISSICILDVGKSGSPHPDARFLNSSQI